MMPLYAYILADLESNFKRFFFYTTIFSLGTLQNESAGAILRIVSTLTIFRGDLMDNELNLRLLGMMHQISYLMQTQEKFRGQGRLLVLLSQYGALTQRELIELTGRRSATLSEQLDGMEKSGLISRCKNEQDKRNVDVELTEQGKKAAIEAMQIRQAYADELFDTIPQRKKQQLAGLLDSLLHTWDIPINEEEYQFYDSEE